MHISFGEEFKNMLWGAGGFLNITHANLRPLFKTSKIKVFNHCKAKGLKRHTCVQGEGSIITHPEPFSHNFLLVIIFAHRFLGLKIDGRINFCRKIRSPTYIPIE